MKLFLAFNLRTRLTLWYVFVLAALLVIYAALVFMFQYAVLTKQIVHDEIQDVETVEGLLYFDKAGALQLKQDYYSQPQSHLLIDRLMEVRDGSGHVLYSSPTLHGMRLGGAPHADEGVYAFNERLIRLHDGRHVLLISHIHGMAGQTLLIRLGYSLAPLRVRMVQFLALLVLAIPFALVIAGTTGQTIVKRALRPIESMAAKAESITSKNLHDRLSIHTPHDELGHLASVFNHLLDRLEQAFVQLQRFTADVAHELRTPIAALRTVGEVALEEERGVDSYRESISSILEETSRLSETIDSLLLLAHVEAVQEGLLQESWSLDELIHEILSLLGVLIEENDIAIDLTYKRTTRTDISIDRSLIRMALLNVIHNAVKFSYPKSTIRIAVTKLSTDATPLTLIVENNGPEIPHGEHERIFERFFKSSSISTSAQSGTGLGLPVAKLIVERLGGSIHYDPQCTTGAKCFIVLP